MIHAGAIGPDHRANLRHLRATFEAAFDAIEDPSDRTTPEFSEADFHYRAWVKAIDGAAMALLDDLDAWEASAKEGEGRATGVVPQSPAVPETRDLADLFGGMSEHDRTMDLIGAFEIDREEEQLYEGP